MAETQILEKTDAAIAQIADQITGLVGEHGLEAVELAGRVYQLSAAGKLLTPLVLVLLAVFGTIIAVRMARTSWRLGVADGNDSRVVAFAVPAIVLGVASVISGVFTIKFTITGLTSPLVWAAAFNPEIALAAHILSRL